MENDKKDQNVAESTEENNNNDQNVVESTEENNNSDDNIVVIPVENYSNAADSNLEENHTDTNNSDGIETVDANENNNGSSREAPTYRGIRVMPYIIGNEAFEKISSVGMSSILPIYLNQKFHMKTNKVNQVVNNFHGACDIASIVSAFLSDAFFGRYNCLVAGCIASSMGMIVLMLTAFPSLEATRAQLAILYSAFGLLVIGAGGIRSCSLTFGAEQFPANSRGTQSFFVWSFVTTSIAFLVGSTLIVYLHSKNPVAGFAVPASLMLLSSFLFFRGTNLYVRNGPKGSPFTSFAQVIVVSFKKRSLEIPSGSPNSLFNFVPPESSITRLSQTNQFRFLDKAAIATTRAEVKADGSATNPWQLCTLQQVEEVKCWLRVMPIWAASIIFNISMNVLNNYKTFQVQRLDRHLGKTGFKIPVGSYGVFSALGGVFLVSIYDRIVVPLIEKRTGRIGGFTLLQRMGTGIVFGILTMLVSGLVEKFRKDLALSKPSYASVSPMSSFVLLPQLVFAGFAEAFYATAQMNFFYDLMPENTKTFVQAMGFSAGALSTYSTNFIYSRLKRNWLVDDINMGRLDFFYYTVAGFQILNFVYFLLCARWYSRNASL